MRTKPDTPHHPRARLALASMALALLVLFASGCPSEEPEEPEPPAVEVMTTGLIPFEEWIETFGTVEAPEDAMLSAQVSGTLMSVADEGQAVRRGQIVAQLDPGQAVAAVQQAQAAVAEARVAVDQADDEIRRVEPLARDTIISPLEFDQLRAQRAQAQATLQQAQAAQREAQERLEQTRLRAPFDGVVEDQIMRTGEQVSAGMEVIRIVSPGPMEVTAGIPERFAGDIRVGSDAIVRLHAYGIPDRRGTVRFVGQAIDPQNRTFRIRIDLPAGEPGIKADMIARVRVVRRTLPSALVLPLGAVQRDERGESVLLASGEDTLRQVERQPVEVGPRSEDGVVIEEGLRVGQDVIVAGTEQVVEGDTVRVTRWYSDIIDYRRSVADEMRAADRGPAGDGSPAHAPPSP